MSKGNETRKVLIEIEYEPNHTTPAGIRLNLKDTSVVDIIVAWSALTEKVINVTTNPDKGQSLTQFLGNTMRVYAIQKGADHYDEDDNAEEELVTQE
ncbi:MAG: hypothetical protein KIG16_04575 [Eubacteriales bacterium]|nr:hypothetical protein [Eubacteriales bacterium]